MELWAVYLINSTEIKIKAKKKDLFKTEKKYLTVMKVDNGNEEEIYINKQGILWIKKIEQ